MPPLQPRPRYLSLLVAVLLVGLVACSANGDVPSPPSSVPVTAPPSTPPSSASPTGTQTPSCVDRTLDAMTLDERVGQLFLLGLDGETLAPAEAGAIRTHYFGSVWFTRTTNAGVDGVRATTGAVQALAADATGGVGFFVAANQEGGLIQALRGSGFSTIPTADEQGTLPTETLRRDAQTWGREMALAGVNMNFAPVADVVPPGNETTNQPIGVLHRGYGHDAPTVGAAVTAFIDGMESAGIATTVKHFPGLGRVEGNTDQTADVVDTETTADDASLDSFRQAIRAGVPFAMVALATYTRIDPEHLAVFSPVVMRLLRDGLGFDGVIVSDDLGATAAVASIDPGTRAIDFLQAGGDLVIARGLDAAVQMVEAVASKAASDPAFDSLVDAAALHVLQAKATYGLLACA